MPDRIVGSKAARWVQELLDARQGREYLRQYGWTEGLPIVVAYPSELIDDVMGIMSSQKRPGLVAMCEEKSGKICLLHISRPSAALITVDAEAPRARMVDLFERAKRENMLTFELVRWIV